MELIYLALGELTCLCGKCQWLIFDIVSCIELDGELHGIPVVISEDRNAREQRDNRNHSSVIECMASV